ncbi:MAG: hypothetical protein WC583_00995 [Candidatus Omnitrophota bacterium]|nr:hypothetical protein [Candidatus Omnitrophota bacterium]MDD3982367.1 hypothetical protein [Candidatus Omnitrophota bacterium]MDD5526493.1 hypothetical protein [Candidatus Omnitrophota bacterium]
MEINREADYSEYMFRKETLWEGRCRRCGACCGVLDDPCEHLRPGNTSGQYYCDIYEMRFGLRRTVSGKEFHCVPLRSVLHQHWASDHLCAYKEGFTRPWPENI